ncbi:ependymin-like, partial [Clarias magur]
TPPLFGGSFSVLAQNGDYLALGEYSYDAILQRIYFGELVVAENSTKTHGILLLYQEKVMYLMDYKQQTCKKQALTSKFSPMEVPANATLLAQVVLGSLSAPSEGVLVNTWTGDLPEVQAGVSFFTKVLYKIDYKQQTCKKQELTSEFHPIEIPSNATFLAQVVLGSLSAPNEGVLVNSWAGEIPEVQGQYVMTFTEFGCLPVSALYRMRKTDVIVY